MTTHKTTAPRAAPAPAAQGDALLKLIEQHGRAEIARLRINGRNGPMVWEIELGCGEVDVSGDTLEDAIARAAKEWGA